MPNPEPDPRGDRAFTYRVTFISLSVGLILAVLVGLILLSLRQPPTTDEKGSVIWSLGMFMLPLAGLLSTVILGMSVFYLPVVLARRQGMILDPQIWPATGAAAVGVIVVIAFVAAIFAGII